MRRKILCLLSVVLIFCGGLFLLRQDNTETEKEPSHTLRIALWDYDVVSYDKKLIEQFQEDHPEITIEVISYPPIYYNFSLNALLDSGERVDIFFVNQLDQLSQIISNDIALPLDDFIEENDVNLNAYPGIDVLRERQGELLALPYRKDKFLLYYNRDLFEQVGIAEPKQMTWETFAQTAADLTARLEAGQYGAYFQKNTRRIPRLMRDDPFDWQSDDFAEMKKELHFFKQMEQQGSIPLYSFCESQSASQRSFETGNYGMFIHGTWYLNYLESDREQGMFDFDWGVAAKPNWDAASSDVWSPTQLTPVCIHKDTTEPEAAWTFLHYLCGKEGAAILAKELILPAYEDAEIRALLEQKLRAYGIEPSLVLDGFDPPEPPLGIQEQALMDRVYQKYEDALIGLCTPEEAISEIRAMR